jgi:hypothetical protein
MPLNAALFVPYTVLLGLLAWALGWPAWVQYWLIGGCFFYVGQALERIWLRQEQHHEAISAEIAHLKTDLAALREPRS